MARKFSEIRDRTPPERRERIRKRTEELLAELPLQELRQARSLSQKELAEVLGLNQATISKLERRTDMYLSSLRDRKSKRPLKGGDKVGRGVWPCKPPKGR